MRERDMDDRDITALLWFYLLDQGKDEITITASPGDKRLSPVARALRRYIPESGSRVITKRELESGEFRPVDDNSLKTPARVFRFPSR